MYFLFKFYARTPKDTSAQSRMVCPFPTCSHLYLTDPSIGSGVLSPHRNVNLPHAQNVPRRRTSLNAPTAPGYLVGPTSKLGNSKTLTSVLVSNTYSANSLLLQLRASQRGKEFSTSVPHPQLNVTSTSSPAAVVAPLATIIVTNVFFVK